MGCNCGDNEYEIIVDNNGSCEPTTPEYYITLENVGVDGFSPTINQVNVTSSSFQLQITDVNGTETTGNIPLLSYLDNNFVTNTDLADTLTAYVTSTSLATTLTNYVTNTSLATTLADYVTNSNLTTTLADYVTNTSLSTTLNNYVTNSSLSSTLSAYALNADVVHKAGTETITGNKVFGAIYAYRIVGNPNNASMSIDTYNSGQNLYIGAGEAGFIQIGNNYNNPDIRLVGDTATFNGENIATVDQIPTVGNGTITITQGGVSKGTFTTNQSGNTTIDLDEGGGSTYTAGNGIDITNDTISIDTSVVAQLSDIPTVNNPTITFTQGGVTKGTITLNQSGNQTIAFDAGGGVTNPIELVKTYTDNSNNIVTATLTIGFTSDDYPTPIAKYNFHEDYSGGGDAEWNYNLLSNTYAKTKGGLKNNYSGTFNTINALEVAVDNNTIKINTNGELYADIGGGSTYTAGDGIDITNDVISAKVDGTTIDFDSSGNLTVTGGGGATIDDTTPSTTTVYSSQKTQDLINAKEDKFIVGEGIVLEEVTTTFPNNLTSGTPSDIVYADGYEGTYYPYMAFDGDTNTKWGLADAPTEQNPHWLVRDLENAYPIARVVIRTESSSEVINGGYIQGSNDKTNWTNIGTIDNTGDLTKTITCDSNTAYRYIRLYCTSAYGWGFGKVNEMTIYISGVKVLSISPTILNLITDLQDRITALEANINGGNA